MLRGSSNAAWDLALDRQPESKAIGWWLPPEKVPTSMLATHKTEFYQSRDGVVVLGGMDLRFANRRAAAVERDDTKQQQWPPTLGLPSGTGTLPACNVRAWHWPRKKGGCWQGLSDAGISSRCLTSMALVPHMLPKLHLQGLVAWDRSSSRAGRWVAPDLDWPDCASVCTWPVPRRMQ